MTIVRRRLLLVAWLTLGWIMACVSPALAHGIGGRADLPVPVSFFIVGAGIAVVVSFVALAVLWPTPRFTADAEDQSPLKPLGWIGTVLAVVGLIALGLVVAAGVVNRDGGRTISGVLVWVYFWLVVPFIAAALGNWWKAISPFRAVASFVNKGVPEDTEMGARLGMWPAAVAFVAFTWLELVSPSSAEARTLALAAVVYSFYTLIITRRLGVETGLSSGGAFENYNDIIGAMAPLEWGRPIPSENGVTGLGNVGVRRRGWLRGLTGLGDTPGFTAFVVAMIGTVTYDGLSGAEWWGEAFGSAAREQWFGTLALVGVVLVIGAAYWLASWSAARMAQRPGDGATVARSFAHTLVPIALAYAVAHYFTLVLVEGQLLLHTASDPFGLGWDLFGTASWRIGWVPTPEVVWYLQVAMIVAGHVAGVVLAHDRALRDFGGRVAVKTQYAMLVLMVALTSLGLLILSG